jgi:phage FluMu protein gp41
MTTVKVTLIKGLKIGDAVHTAAEIREATAGDMIEATEESERLVLTPEGNYVLVASPTLVGLNTLRRQIVKVGTYDGPLTLTEIKMLSGPDINLLQQKAAQLENAGMQDVTDRGK